jgi:cytoskeletal protein CcmA (bactofilin family)
MFGFGSSAAASDKKSTGAESTLSIVAPGTTVVGDLLCEGDISIKGRLVGNLICKSRVVIGAKGVVEGNIDTVNAAISGRIKGKLVVRGLLELKEAAVVDGDIIAENIAMEKGAVHNGTNFMASQAKDQLGLLKEETGRLEGRLKQAGTQPQLTAAKPATK